VTSLAAPEAGSSNDVRVRGFKSWFLGLSESEFACSSGTEMAAQARWQDQRRDGSTPTGTVARISVKCLGCGHRGARREASTAAALPMVHGVVIPAAHSFAPDDEGKHGKADRPPHDESKDR
jgi:hypothetical protein